MVVEKIVKLWGSLEFRLDFFYSLFLLKLAWFPYFSKQFERQTETKVFQGSIFLKHHNFSTTTTANASEEGSEKEET